MNESLKLAKRFIDTYFDFLFFETNETYFIFQKMNFNTYENLIDNLNSIISFCENLKKDIEKSDKQ